MREHKFLAFPFLSLAALFREDQLDWIHTGLSSSNVIGLSRTKGNLTSAGNLGMH